MARASRQQKMWRGRRTARELNSGPAREEVAAEEGGKRELEVRGSAGLVEGEEGGGSPDHQHRTQ